MLLHPTVSQKLPVSLEVYCDNLTVQLFKQELLELMGARLVEIKEWWEDGQLSAAGFSAEEIKHLVRALFEETDLREQVLAIIVDEE